MEAFNLTFQIAIGYLLQNAGVVALIAVSAVVLYGAMLIKKLSLIEGKSLKTAIVFGVALCIFFILLLPTFTLSSLSQVTYATDWFMLVFMSFGYAAIGAALLYPVLRIFKQN